MHELLTENEWAFRDKEMEDFKKDTLVPSIQHVTAQPDFLFTHSGVSSQACTLACCRDRI